MKKERTFEKSVRFLAAAALSAALLGSQLPVVFAAESSVESASGIKLEELFPDNITVSDPVSLSEVEFPDSKYGKLKWLDDSMELTEHVQSCEAVFVPKEGIDLTDMEGWDKELGGVVSSIHVIVTGISGEEAGELEDEEEEPDTESEDVDAVEEEVSGESQDEQDGTEDTEENVADTEEPSEESGDGQENGEIVPEDTVLEEEDSEEGVESGETDARENGGEESENEEVQDNSETDKEDSDTEGNDNSGSEIENSEDAELPQDGEADGEENDSSNIFDDPADFETEDQRPTELPENLTEEEKLQHAAVNHSHEGISVSGINLPWYVQFRVTSGESYEFANESDAMIFKSYEFELWDLQNNTEYEIPDGEYISVTVPVKEGYDYTVEHLLDNGATETIIPSVEGGTMVFSTHSFSPFGIAGSMQMVGPDFPIGDEVKPTVTPTPTITGKPGEGGTSGNSGNTGSSGNNGGTNSGSGTTGGTAGSTGSNTGDIQSGGTGNSGGTGSSAGTGSSSGSGQNGTSGNSSTGNGTVNNNGNSTGSQTSGSHAVETGDTTAILPFVALILAALILIGAVVYLKTKKK